MLVKELIEKIKDYPEYDVSTLQWTVDAFYEDYEIEGVEVSYKREAILLVLQSQESKFD